MAVRPTLSNVLRQFASNIIPIAVNNHHNTEIQMPTTQINIVLSESRVLAGDYLKAKILLDSSDPDTVIHSFIAEVKGVGRTGWVNIHTDKIFETEKGYINEQIEICPSGMAVPVGKHQFPIQVLIPELCPSSYESQFGTIRYQIKVILNANTEQATCSEVFPIVVLARSFFDDVPINVLSPIDFRDEVDFTCCSLPFGCVSIKVLLPRTAYRLGESVEAQVSVENKTRKGLRDCALLLSMKSQFEARSRYEHVNEKKLSEQLIELIPLGNVRPRSKSDFDKCSIRIPEGAPPTQNYNKGGGETAIISIHYVVKFTALPGIECEIPLIVTSRGYSDSGKQAAFVVHSQRVIRHDAGRVTRNIVEEKMIY